MKVLVTGANGQIGRSLVERLNHSDWQWEAHGRDTLDIADETAVAALLERFQPNALINAAAYTAVDKAESEPDVARRGNVEGPAALARACEAAGCVLIHLSTDYVFSGEARRPYVESDWAAPQGVYGRTKLDGEIAVRAICPAHVIVRTSWVFSEHGHNFMKTILRLSEERTELRVVSDQFGCPTYAGDIATTLLNIADQLRSGKGDLFGTYHYAGDKAVSWFDFAKVIVGCASNFGVIHKAPAIHPISTDDYPTAAKRPANSCLNTELISQTFNIGPSNWKQSLELSLKLMSCKSVATNRRY